MTTNSESWLSQRMRRFERRLLVLVMRRCNGVVTHAARAAGRNRTEFYRLLARHGLKPKAFKLEKAA